MPDLRKSWNPSQMALEKNPLSWGLCWGNVMPKPRLLWGREEVCIRGGHSSPTKLTGEAWKGCKAWAVPAGGQAAGLQQHVLITVLSRKPWLAVSPNTKFPSPRWEFEFDLFIGPRHWQIPALMDGFCQVSVTKRMLLVSVADRGHQQQARALSYTCSQVTSFSFRCPDLKFSN